jgi:hypothetical protein
VRHPLLPALALAVTFGLSKTTAKAQEAPSAGFSSFARYLVLVEGDRGRGSGAVVKFRGNPLILTNAHVLSGNSRVEFRLLNNRTLRTGTFGVARNVDLAVFTQEGLADGLEILENADEHAAVGDDIVVLGNSLGRAVATELPGKIVGIGPELIEIDAKFVSGNSGSPVIHRKTGKVIAIATFATLQEADPLVDDSPFKDVRRFAVRLDTVSQWEYPTWEKFTQEALQLASSVHAFNLLMTLADDMADDGYLDASNYLNTDERFQRRIRNYISDIKRPKMSSSYYFNTKTEFLRWIETQAAEPPRNLRPETFTQYHGESIRRMHVIRRKLREFFGLVRAAQGGGDRIDLVQREMRERWAR